MGLFNRFKSMFTSSGSSHDHGRASADLAEEKAQANETSRAGLLGPRIAEGTGHIFARTGVNDPTAEAKLRVAANHEDDGSKEMLIQKERRAAERPE
jgi:hypothetical protein